MLRRRPSPNVRAAPLAAMPLPPTYHFPKKDSPLSANKVIYSRPRVALPSAASSATFGREQHYRRPRVDNLEWGLARLLIGTEKESVPPKHTDVFGGTPNL